MGVVKTARQDHNITNHHGGLSVCTCRGPADGRPGTLNRRFHDYFEMNLAPFTSSDRQSSMITGSHNSPEVRLVIIIRVDAVRYGV